MRDEGRDSAVSAILWKIAVAEECGGLPPGQDLQRAQLSGREFEGNTGSRACDRKGLRPLYHLASGIDQRELICEAERRFLA
jgi:hypothetical protein